jgi:hypothetical protein
MRSVINTVANVTSVAIANRVVRTALAGVDGLRASSQDLRFYHAAAQHAAPAPRWAHKPFAGKQKPAGTAMQAGAAMQAGTGPSLGGGSELSRCSRREMSRCRRSRVWRCLARS